MTGLDVDNDVIIEIFCIIANGNLDVVHEGGWGAVIHQSKETMDKMVCIGFLAVIGAELVSETGRVVHQNAWRKRTHRRSDCFKNNP